MKADPSRYLEFRRDIHRHPELSNQEVETTRRIREFLARDGLELCPIGALNGGFVRINAGKARTLCMRADIDALPLTEHTALRSPPSTRESCTPAATICTPPSPLGSPVS